MQATAGNSPTPSSVPVIEQKLRLEGRFKSGIGWFYWIGGLSALNTVVYTFGGSITFITGLAITQLIDGLAVGIASAITENFGQNAGTIATLGGVLLSLVVSGLFVAFGWLGRQRLGWIVVFGMVLYAVDALIFLAFSEWLAALFHVWALSGLWGGLKAMRELTALETAISTGNQAVAYQQVAAGQLADDERRSRLQRFGLAAAILVGIIVFVLISALVAGR